ncbi:helix-turn-helix domain-containing protein [Streptomyces jumonjinensis]|uniref:helix-turn-helix domain-containing protein n=1 Tax=Streptomyces jumonjinensis TaxID=1945 RepID=UPI002B1EFCEA|nr:helix-turn-helix domain-containing protein [Streptomyces jumonjinensis]
MSQQAARIAETKTDVARRLRHVRQHHPEGPFTVASLAKRSGVSQRTLSAIESAAGVNLTLETLLKVAGSLGIKRHAYFLDEKVFDEVNAELTALVEVRKQGITGVALRSTTYPENTAAHEMAALLSGILDSARKAKDVLKVLPHNPDGETPGKNCAVGE